MAGDPRPRPRFAAAGGFTPQAKNMPRLRRSNQGVTPEGLHGGSTSGANLLREETTFCLLDLGSCIWMGGWNQPASIPPSTGMIVPVIQEEASESRKTIIAATSSG